MNYHVGLLAYLLYLSVCDIRKKRISGKSLVLGGVLAFMGSVVSVAFFRDMSETKIYVMNIFLGTIPGFLLVLIGIVTQKLGIADGLVLTFIGMLVGYRVAMVVLLLAALLSFLLSAGILLSKKGTKETTIPFIPFMFAGYVLSFCLT